MKAKIIYIYGSDVDPVELYQPEKSDNFGFWIEVMMGIKGQVGEESFQICVCSPQWLIENQSKDKIVLGLHHLIMFEYDYQILYAKLQKLMCIEGKDWNEISQKLSYIGYWEFQDYKS